MSSPVDRLYRRVQMASAALTITATDDTGPVHKVQGKVRGTPETIDNLQVVQIYGLASHAPIGSDAFASFGNGDRSNGVIHATGNQAARPRNQQPGEVTLYTDEGTTIALRSGKVVVITSQTVQIIAASVSIAGPGGGNAVVNITGDLHATGTITAPHGKVGP